MNQAFCLWVLLTAEDVFAWLFTKNVKAVLSALSGQKHKKGLWTYRVFFIHMQQTQYFWQTQPILVSISTNADVGFELMTL